MELHGREGKRAAWYVRQQVVMQGARDCVKIDLHRRSQVRERLLHTAARLDFANFERIVSSL